MDITIQDLLGEAVQELKKNQITTPRLDAEVILAHQLKWRRIDLIVRAKDFVEPREREAYKRKIQERIQGKPVQYITGQQEFMGLLFKVTPDVLIPRPDTEILVETALEEARKMKQPLHIVDIGTGSGAIALSLAHYIEKAKVHTVDISSQASQVAQENARELSLEEKVNFYVGDVFAPLGRELLHKVDLLVSNPPYIPRGDIPHLQREVSLFEPHLALDGGIDGLDFYRRLVAEGKEFLSPQGRMIFEVGHDQAERVGEMMEKEDIFVEIRIIRDLAGIKRVVMGERRIKK